MTRRMPKALRMRRMTERQGALRKIMRRKTRRMPESLRMRRMTMRQRALRKIMRRKSGPQILHRMRFSFRSEISFRPRALFRVRISFRSRALFRSRISAFSAAAFSAPTSRNGRALRPARNIRRGSRRSGRPVRGRNGPWQGRYNRHRPARRPPRPKTCRAYPAQAPAARGTRCSRETLRRSARRP